jgi:hypothetical protein
LSGGGRIRRVDRVHIVVLVTGFILHEEYVLAVTRPEVSRDRALGIGRDRFRIGKRIASLLHPDVPRAFERFDEGDERSVRGNLCAGNLRVTKEQLTVNQRGLLRPRRRRECDYQKD